MTTVPQPMSIMGDRVPPDASLTVRDDEGRAHVRCSYAGGSFSVILTREDERKLFNWLGVHLHC